MQQTLHNLSEAQRERLGRFGTTQCVDIHCHCLPALDDGPSTIVEAVAMCRALVADGITVVVATPHQLGRYDGHNEAADVRRAVASLNATLAAEGVPLTVLPGADVRLDERIPELLAADRILTLADGGEHLMVELPSETFIDLGPLVAKLSASGLRTIVSHPERHEILARRRLAVMPWLRAGATLQLTAASLLGEFGSAAEAAAWYWLGRHPGTLVATDAHDTAGRGPRMSQAIDAIARRLGHLRAKRACIDNPLRMLRGRELPAPPARVRLGGRA